MGKSVVREKSYLFAIDIVDLYKKLIKENKEFVLSKQLLRSGTSIGANIREAKHSQSKADFIHKFSISQKETEETMYWLDLLYDTNYISEELHSDLHDKCMQLQNIITKIIVTTKRNL